MKVYDNNISPLFSAQPTVPREAVPVVANNFDSNSYQTSLVRKRKETLYTIIHEQSDATSPRLCVQCIISSTPTLQKMYDYLHQT
jgi:hypothetical protein